jgi:hypothetical protein
MIEVISMQSALDVIETKSLVVQNGSNQPSLKEKSVCDHHLAMRTVAHPSH